MSNPAGRAAMPAPGTSKAPKTFDGDDEELQDFLDQFETLADAAKLNDKEKTVHVGKYVARKQRNLFEVLTGFEPANWELFKKSLTELYPNAFKARRYTRQSLEAFTARTARMEISDEDELNAYYRNFLTIAQWLVTNKRITEVERDRQFWFGFHPRTCKTLKQQLRISKPDHKISVPYDYKDVLDAAKYLFDDEAFDLDVQPHSKGSKKVSWVDRMEDEEEQDDGRDEEERTNKGKSGAKTSITVTEDLDTLIKKLSSLQVHDTNYAVNYAKLVLRYPTVAKDIPRPAFYTTAPTAPGPPVPYSPRPAYVLQSNHPRTCGFCKWAGCFTHSCDMATQYIREGKIIKTDAWYRWPDGARIQTHEKGIKFIVDSELERLATHRPAGAQVQEVPPQQSMFIGSGTMPTQEPTQDAFIVEIEEVQDEDAPILAMTTPVPTKPAVPTSTTQYKFRSKIEDTINPETTFDSVLDTPVTLPLRQVLANSPDVRKRIVDSCKTTRVMPATEVLHVNKTVNIPYHCPPRELDILLPGNKALTGVFDTASALVNIRRSLVTKLGLAMNPDIRVSMTMANGGGDSTYGVVENLPIIISSVTIPVHAHVVDDSAPYDILLGRPFQVVGRIDTKDAGETLIIHDPTQPTHRIHVPTRPHAPTHHHCHFLGLHTAQPHTIGVEPLPILAARKYKKVADRTKPVATTLPENFRIKRRVPEDPLLSLIPLNPHPVPVSVFGNRLTKERWEGLKINEGEFLRHEEVKLVFSMLMNNEEALAWDESEKGRFRDDYFAPVIIPTVEHKPWAERNYPIPPGLFQQVVQIIKDKISSGVFEPSSSSYRSRWFCVVKKNGSLRMVHDLRPLNAVTIQDAGLPPPIEQYAERCGGRGVYSMMDIFVGYDHRSLDERSRDLTTFQTPLGPHRLTVLPMGATNAVSTFHGDVSFILQDELEVSPPFIDDVPVLGPTTRYQDENGTYETHPENAGIRRFIWEHLTDVNRILHRFKHAGATLSAKKLFIAVPEATIVGHRCTFDGRIPDSSKVDKILSWPACQNISEVRGFLGTCGVVRIFIENFAKISRPLVALTNKGTPFIWENEQIAAMQTLKNRVVSAPALKALDYTSGRQVILAVDSSNIAVGWILLQLDEQGRRRPSRYGSIAWNEREARYSQAKLELYGLFRALRASRLHLVGLPTFTVEVDAKYIQGMINNPDIQPNATLNRWIMAILLFNFDLVHIPGREHKGPDGLSRRKRTEGDIVENEGEAEDWVDEMLEMGVWANTWYERKSGKRATWIVKTTEGEEVIVRMEEQEEEGGRLQHSKAATTQKFPVFAIQTTIRLSNIQLPRTTQSELADGELVQIQGFLSTTQKPSDLDDKRLRQFLNKAQHFFVKNGKLWRRQQSGNHQLVIEYERRMSIMKQAHDDLGHKGLYYTRRLLLDRFWWPGLERDLAWYTKTCHECQIRNMAHILIPPTPSTPAPLFRKAYLDTAFMPTVNGFRYLLQARCSLTNYPEWTKLRKETGAKVGKFIFENLLCRWGVVETIVTDNGKAIVAGLDWLRKTYHINHIRISPYNKRANGIVERSHRTIRESLVKACHGDMTRWPAVAPFIFWADRVTIRKSTGYSPFYMAHGIEPTLPFDLTEATFLLPKLDKPLDDDELIAVRARQLEKRDGDLATIHNRVLQARYTSIAQFEKDHAHTIRDFKFETGALVLIRDSRLENDLSSKTKPRYFGPMVVIRRTQNGAYILAELNGAIGKLPYAAFRLIPYHARSRTIIPLTTLDTPNAEVSRETPEES